MASNSAPLTRDQWRDALLEKMRAERPHWDRMDAYYRGLQGIPIHSSDKEMGDAVRRLLQIAMSNTPRMIVEAPLDRMIPIGCRTAAEGDQLGDEVGSRIWKGNDYTAKTTLTFELQLSMGMGYQMVGSVDPNIGVPLITVEDPRECTTISDPATGQTLAGAKMLTDGKLDRLYVYLPGAPARVHRATRPANWRPTPNDVDRMRILPHLGGWEWEDEDGEELPTTRVPLVPFRNMPDAAGRPTAEFEPHIGVIDRINYLTLQRLEITTLQAFRQRALKGGPTHDPLTGEEIDYDDIFKAGPGAMWHIPPESELWESDAVDIRPLIEAEKAEYRTLAGVSGTPLFYIAPEASDGSAEGAALAKEKLIFKTKRRIQTADPSVKLVTSIAFEIMGESERARLSDIEIMWMPPERFSLSETADAATKALGSLSRREVLRDIWRKNPDDIQRIESDLMAEALMGQGITAMTELVNGTGTGVEPVTS